MKNDRRGRRVETVPPGFDLLRRDAGDLIHLVSEGKSLCGRSLGTSYHEPQPPFPGKPQRVCKDCLAATRTLGYTPDPTDPYEYDSCDTFRPTSDDLLRERDALQAEVEQLRAELGDALRSLTARADERDALADALEVASAFISTNPLHLSSEEREKHEQEVLTQIEVALRLAGRLP